MGKEEFLRRNVCSQIFFCWMLPLFLKGNRRTLNHSDLYSIEESVKVELTGKPLVEAWENTVKKGHPSLWNALISLFWKHFILLGITFFLKECVLQVAVSVILGIFLESYGEIDTSQKTLYILASLLVSSSALYFLIHNLWDYYSMKLGYKMGVACATLVYYKTLKLNPTAIRRTSAAQVTNLIAGDIARFESSMGVLHSLWAGPMLVLIVGTYIWTMFGPVSVTGLLAMGILVPAISYMGHFYGILRARKAVKTDSRLKILNEIVTGIRLIKTYTWEYIFMDMIEDARDEELDVLSTRQNLVAFYSNVTNMLPRLTVLVTVVFYVFLSTGVTAEKVFVTMTLYNLTAIVINNYFTNAVLKISETKISVKRIQSFLLLEDNKDPGVKHLESINYTGEISVRNYTAGWKVHEPTIWDISFRVKPNEPVFVLGTVGSGKSTIISGILGELLSINGDITVTGKLAYAPQNPWTFPGTIRENILFGKNYNYEWYTNVVSSCCLDQDIKGFPNGDMTIVGDKGISLSGGQRARISLARAVYANSDVYLIDDVLSAVDADVGQQIFQKVFNNLLKTKVLLIITHQVQYVGNCQVLLVKDGRIYDKGPGNEVKERNPELFTLLEEKPDSDDKIQEDKKIVRKLSSVKTLPEESFTEHDLATDKEVLLKSYGTFVESDEDTLPYEEKRETGTVGLGICWQYLRAGNSIFFIILILLFNMGTQACLSFSDTWLSIWTASTTNLASTTYCLIYTSLLLIVFFIGWIASYGFFRICINAGRALHNRAVSAIIRARLTFFEQNPAGRIVNRFSKDMGAADEELSVTLFSAMNSGLQVLGVMSVSSAMNPALIGPSLVLLLICYFVRRFYLKASSDVKRLEAVARSPVYALIDTTVEGLSCIQAFGVQDVFRQRFSELKDSHSTAYCMYIGSFCWLLSTLNWMSLGFEAVVVFSFVLFAQGKSAAGLAIASVLTLGELFSFGMQRSAELENDLVSVERLSEYGNIEPEARLGPLNPKERWAPSIGRITIENLNVFYGSKVPVLKQVSLDILGGEKVGIVGRTGAGKTTLVSVLLRLVEPASGKIMIDGKDVSDLGLHELRSKISIISQTPAFLEGSIRRNLDPFCMSNDDELWRVLDSVHLAYKVKQFPEGIHYVISAGGTNFSQGERQLISLARALLSKNRILILDEATASVDYGTDSIIQKQIREKFRTCTVITIAHRLETVLDCDRICVMDNGEVAEFDKPSRLLENKNSRLSKLMSKVQEVQSQGKQD